MPKLKSFNPSTGKILGEVEISSDKEVVQKIESAQKAKTGWRSLGIDGRVKSLRKVVGNLVKRKEELTTMASKEMGMPITMAKSDLDDAARYLNWYLDNAKECLSPEVVYEDKSTKHTVYREPIGVGAHITPWNFPSSNFVWSIGQSLVSGNVVVYKTSEEVLLCGKIIEEIFTQSELPNGVFSEIYGDSGVGKMLVNGNVNFICFTGSTKTGKYLYEIAAKRFVRIFLELGGSAPGIVFEDADVDRVLDSIFGNRFLNSGQICDGLKRLIVHESIEQSVLGKLSEKVKNTKIGDALDEKTEIGPLVSKKQLNTLLEQVKDAVDKGAKVIIGGQKPKNLDGFFYEPTILVNINKNMRVWNEEVFGPVLPVMTFKTEEDAIRLANDTEYGLGSYIFTEDNEKALRVAEKLETGMVSTNNAMYLQPTSPFGGYKSSGIGREHGKFGFNDLTQIKVVAEEK